MSNRKLKRYSYLAIIPRGLESEVSQGLQNEAKAVVDIGTDDGNDQCIRNNEDINNKSNVLCISSWNEEDDDKTMQEALRDFAVQKIEKRKKRQTHEIKKTLKHQPTNSQLEEKITSEELKLRPKFPFCVVNTKSSTKQGRAFTVPSYIKNPPSLDIQ